MYKLPISDESLVTKLRPGLSMFLDTIASFYEVIIYTMGSRNYAKKICAIIDPSKRIIADRIISKDDVPEIN
jgi:RNA polymerase II subunit A-like phosphatase